METRHSNARLSLYEIGDMSAFIVKKRRAPSNVSPLIYVIGDT
jgi:hypothetical protein